MPRINGVRRGVLFKGRWYSPGADFHRAVRKELIKILGNKCCQCGFSDWRALQVDHVNGTSKHERISATFPLYKDVLKSITENTNKYQLLCANCNWIKKYENNENPNIEKVSADLSSGYSVQSLNTNLS